MTRDKMPQVRLNTLCSKMREGLPKLGDIFTWQLLKTLLMGQILSVLICGTAVTSQYLASVYYLNTPMLQSFIHYTLLCITYTTALIFRKGDGNILQILKTKWWKYVLLGLTDVEANYAVVKAYQYTTLTSIQLLDCFVIPVLMILSWFFLKTRYRITHFVSVCICLAGVGAMVGADILAGQDQGSTSNILLGDGLVLVSATLYAVSNVCQEYTVKNLSRVEFLGMIGLFGTVISGIQLGIIEHSEVSKIQWNWEVALLLAGYALCMYGFYSMMPIVVKMTSATAVNLSLLTGDLFSLFCGLFLFHYSAQRTPGLGMYLSIGRTLTPQKNINDYFSSPVHWFANDLSNFSGLYIVSLVVILIGFIMFNSVPPPMPTLAPASDEEGSDNQTTESDDENTLRCVEMTTCARVDLERDQVKNRLNIRQPDSGVVINSAKL